MHLCNQISWCASPWLLQRCICWPSSCWSIDRSDWLMKMNSKGCVERLMMDLIALSGGLLNSLYSVSVLLQWSSCFSCLLSRASTLPELPNQTTAPLHNLSRQPSQNEDKTSMSFPKYSILKIQLQQHNEFLLFVSSSLRAIYFFAADIVIILYSCQTAIWFEHSVNVSVF